MMGGCAVGCVGCVVSAALSAWSLETKNTLGYHILWTLVGTMLLLHTEFLIANISIDYRFPLSYPLPLTVKPAKAG